MSTIVTNGLIGYWHFQEGVNGNTWKNIAPATEGQYDGAIDGATLQEDGMYFDGVDDAVLVPPVDPVDNTNVYEIEAYINFPFDATQSTAVPILGALLFDMTTFEQKVFIFAISRNGLGYNESFTGGGSQTFPYTFPKNGTIKINYVVDVTNDVTKVFFNDVLDREFSSGAGNLLGLTESDWAIGGAYYSGMYIGHSKGLFHSLKLYNKELTQAERERNSTVGIDIGLPEDGEPEPDEPNPVESGEINLFASGSLEYEALRNRLSDAQLLSDSDLTSVPSRISYAYSDLSAKGTLHVQPIRRVLGSSALVSNSELHSRGIRSRNNAVDISSTSDSIVQATRIINQHVDLMGTSYLTVTIDDVTIVLGSADFTATSDLTASAHRIVTGQVDLFSLSQLDMDALRVLFAESTLKGRYELDADPNRIVSSRALMSAMSDLSAVGTAIIVVDADLHAVSKLLVSTGSEIIGVIELEGQRYLYAHFSGTKDLNKRIIGNRELTVELKGVIK